MRQKLNMITLGVSDMQRALDFYEKGLGWNRSPASLEDLMLFPLGGIVLALYPRQLLAEDAMVKDTETGFSGITLSYNARSETEVEEVLDRVEHLGATILRRAQKAFWGGYYGYFKDPDGHIVEVAYVPSWELDENDNLKFP